jgi:hypothetical protein
LLVAARQIGEALDAVAAPDPRYLASADKQQLLVSPREAAHAARLGAGLGRWSRVASAVADGRVGWEQAPVLMRSLDDLPAGLEPDRALDSRCTAARLPNGDVRYARRT